ncbi:Ulp1 protease family protein [Abeliophyllum distichum]|uniref:Ulp1 protease family protein n=1 Tax=Abeliophyllum distichum TaxID=126358 RepID=A0ABD1UN19_9LAMI
MEYKIDSLVELAAVGRFHSTTSACDSPIRNTTNVLVAPPEVKRKEEAGPNDVMDELEKERIIEDEDGEELVGGEKVAEDESFSNETKFVEKGTSGDFFTPEKHEEDENKSTKGDIVQIENTGFDIPKGRGHRTKSKARLLCSPFTDPTKRRKLSDLDVYDPYREVDPSKVDDLNKWMEVASMSDLVPLHHCDVEAKCLLDLLNKDGWLTGEIDLEDITIFIFDSLKSHVRKAELEAFMKLLQVVIPILMKLHVKCDDSYSTEKFKFVKMKEVSQQHNESDCGIFTVKYIEFLQANMDVCAIRPEYIPMWIKKLAAELLAWHFEP